MPIFYGATDYNHTYGNTYILVSHEYIYYGFYIKQSLINTNHIRFNRLEFYDNPDRDKWFYVEMDDDMKMPLQFKGIKFTFLSRVTKWRELETYQYFDITSDHEWDPEFIDLNKIHKISQSRRLKRSEFRVQQDTMYIFQSSDLVEGVYVYQDQTSYEAILS